jgi:serine/threonine protein kinase
MKTSLSGRYELRERIAGGAMGTVYEAFDNRLNRPVAVKLLKEHLAEDPTFIERFRREARAAAALTHPNVAHVFDFGNDDGHYYLVMELVEGRDLAQVLGEERALEPWRAADISSKIAAALAHAHEGGLIHRDVKPANVMLGPDDRVKVTDFGIARAAGDSTLTVTGSVMGTAQYISPEQASGENIGPASDIYSLGIVLFEMLTGTVPFTGGSPLSIAMRHIKDEVPRPSQLGGSVPPELDDIVVKATAKEPSARWSDATEMGAELRASIGRSRAAETVEVERGEQTQRLDGLGSTTAELQSPAPKVFPIPGNRYDPKRIGRAVIGVFLALLVLATVLLFWRLADDDPSTPARNRRATATTAQTSEQENDDAVTVDIPASIVGLPYEEQVEIAKAEGFDIRVEFVPTEEVEPGLILDSDPPPGTTGIERSTPITLYVSAPTDDEDDDDDEGPDPKGKAEGHSKKDDDD